MTKSILQPDGEKRCYLTGSRTNLERHHILGGTANRRLSEKYGLWIYLTHDAHTGPNGAQYDAALNLRLKQEAQKAFEAIHGHALWMATFKKNYL